MTSQVVDSIWRQSIPFNIDYDLINVMVNTKRIPRDNYAPFIRYLMLNSRALFFGNLSKYFGLLSFTDDFFWKQQIPYEIGQEIESLEIFRVDLLQKPEYFYNRGNRVKYLRNDDQSTDEEIKSLELFKDTSFNILEPIMSSHGIDQQENIRIVHANLTQFLRTVKENRVLLNSNFTPYVLASFVEREHES